MNPWVRYVHPEARLACQEAPLLEEFRVDRLSYMQEGSGTESEDEVGNNKETFLA